MNSRCRWPMLRSTAFCSFMRWRFRDDPEGLLREVWRVLAPSGRMMAIMPNRRGVWTRTDNTPFGHGRPYSRSQITQLLRADLVHANGMGRSAIRAADSGRLGSAFGDGVGALERGYVVAIRRRSHRRGHQAGLSRDPRAARADAAYSGDGACAGANDIAARRRQARNQLQIKLPAGGMLGRAAK